MSSTEILRTNVDSKTRTIVFSTAVTDESASEFLSALCFLESLGEDNINIVLNSGGGCFYNGMAIYDAIKASKCHITIRVIGHAMSMGAVILQAADRRLATPNAILMLHDGDVTMAESIKPEELSIYTKHDSEMRDRMHRIFADATNRSKKYFASKMTHDWYLTSEQAKKERLIDEVCESLYD